MTMRTPPLKCSPSSRAKFVDSGRGLQILDPDGELVKIIGEPPEVTAERKRKLAQKGSKP